MDDSAAASGLATVFVNVLLEQIGLMQHGFARVRPLQGGLDAWIAADHAVEALSGPESDESPSKPAPPALGRSG